MQLLEFGSATISACPALHLVIIIIILLLYMYVLERFKKLNAMRLSVVVDFSGQSVTFTGLCKVSRP